MKFYKEHDAVLKVW